MTDGGGNHREQTNQSHRPEGDKIPLQIRRVKVVRGTTRPNPDDPDRPIRARVAICHWWDGINEGTDEIPVATPVPRKADDVIFICRPAGGTGLTNPETATDPDDPSTELPVIWREIFVEDKRYTLQITGYSAITGQTNKWRYSWVFVRPTRNNQWDIPTDESEQDGSDISGIYAYNSCEANNSASGMQGDSVNVDLLPPGVNLLPIQGNPVVPAWVETNCDGDAELYFCVPNSITTDCPGP